MDENQLNDVMKVVKQVDLNKQVVEYDNELESDTEDVLPEVEDPDAVIEEVTRKIICDFLGTTWCLFHLLAPIITENGYCNEKTNEYTKTTCSKNPKARRKKKATPIIDV
ncbi:hypothetical protein Tco_0588064 [Tanacetum coccineum]